MSDEALESAVRSALTDVLDPCSCFTENPVNIVDLGIVEHVSVEDGEARVELLLTSPGCTYLPYIEQDVEERVSAIDGVRSVDIVQITDQIWTRERMEDDVRAARRDTFENRMEAAGITPYAEHGD